MALFGLFKRDRKKTFNISDENRIWIEECFNWLIGSFGLPNKNSQLYTYTESLFPNSFHNKEIQIGNLIKDISHILQIESSNISYELIEDIRDSYGIPYEIEGLPFESETKKVGNTYRIFIAKSLLPDRLLARLINELVTVKLFENQIRFDIGDGNDNLMVYFAAIYFGFGVILSQNLFNSGVTFDGTWETKWNYNSDIPQEMLAYCFAIYLKVSEQDISPFKDEISNDFFNILENAMMCFESSSGDLLSRTELEANDLYFQSQCLIKKYEYEKALQKLNEIISISDNMKTVSFISYVYERMGYIRLREQKYEDSIHYFIKSIELEHDNYIAIDNLAYSLIKMGDVIQGKKYIDKSISLTYKDMASIYRNLALYYWAKGYSDEAEENFILSFESALVPVFLLEFDFSQFLLSQGKKEESDKFLMLSIEKGEPESLKGKDSIN
jgi:tetratricopeptide (TPR) repeat protein